MYGFSEEPNNLDAQVLVDILTYARAIYLLRKFDMFFVSLKTRYDINLVAVRQHIECVSTYRVIYDISKISAEIYIDKKSTCNRKCFFLAAGLGFEPRQTESESAVLPLHNPAISTY